MSPLLKNLLIALAGAIVLWVGYTFFFANNDALLTAENAAVASQASRDTQEFLRHLQQLRNLELGAEFFSDPRFQSLVDYRQPVTEEPVGRANPFAPVGQ